MRIVRDGIYREITENQWMSFKSKGYTKVETKLAKQDNPPEYKAPKAKTADAKAKVGE